MKTVSVTELKAKLSAQLEQVQHGGRIVVTSRGTPIAMLVPFEAQAEDADMERLEARGLVRPRLASLPADFASLPRPEDREASVRRAVVEEREGGW